MCDSTSHALPLKYDYFSFLILRWFCFHLPLAWFSGLHLVSWASVSWVYLFSYLMKLNELGVFVCLFHLFATSYSDWYTPLFSHWRNPTNCFHLFVPCKYAPGELAFLNLWDLNKFSYIERFPALPQIVQFILLVDFLYSLFSLQNSSEPCYEFKHWQCSILYVNI